MKSLTLNADRSRWLAKIKHDLVKRATWPARDLSAAKDCADSQSTPEDRDLLRKGLFNLVDEEGACITATELWERLRQEAPSHSLPVALAAFGAAVASAQEAVSSIDSASYAECIAKVLYLETALEKLRQNLENA